MRGSYDYKVMVGPILEDYKSKYPDRLNYWQVSDEVWKNLRDADYDVLLAVLENQQNPADALKFELSVNYSRNIQLEALRAGCTVEEVNQKSRDKSFIVGKDLLGYNQERYFRERHKRRLQAIAESGLPAKDAFKMEIYQIELFSQAFSPDVPVDKKVKIALQFTNENQVAALQILKMERLDDILQFSAGAKGKYQVKALEYVDNNVDDALKIINQYSREALQILSGPGTDLWGNDKVALASQFEGEPQIDVLKAILKNKQNPADALLLNFFITSPGGGDSGQFKALKAGGTIKEVSKLDPRYIDDKTITGIKERHKLRLQAIEKGLPPKKAFVMNERQLHLFLELCDILVLLENNKKAENKLINIKARFADENQAKALEILIRDGVDLWGHNKVELASQFTEKMQLAALEVVLQNKQNPADALEVRFDKHYSDGIITTQFQMLSAGYTVRQANNYGASRQEVINEDKTNAEKRQKLRFEAIEKGLSPQQVMEMDTTKLQAFLGALEFLEKLLDKNKAIETALKFTSENQVAALKIVGVGNIDGALMFKNENQVKALNFVEEIDDALTFKNEASIEALEILSGGGVKLEDKDKIALASQFKKEIQIDTLMVVLRERENQVNVSDLRNNIEKTLQFDKQNQIDALNLLIDRGMENLSIAMESALPIDNEFKFEALNFQLNVLYKEKDEISKKEREEIIQESTLCDSEYKLKAYKLLKLINYDKSKLKQALTFEDNVPRFNDGTPDSRESHLAFKKFFYNLHQNNSEAIAAAIAKMGDETQKEIFGPRLAHGLLKSHQKWLDDETTKEENAQDEKINTEWNRVLKHTGIITLAGAVVEAALITTALAVAMPPAALVVTVVGALIVGAAAIAALAIEGKSYADRVGAINKEHNAAIQAFYTI